MYVNSSDEPEPSWLEPQLELKDFQLNSARDLFASARIYFFRLESCYFLLPREKNFSIPCSMKKKGTFDFKKSFKNSYHKNSSNNTNFHQYVFLWVPKTLLLNDIKKKIQLGFGLKIKVPQLGSAQLGSSRKIPARAHHY